MTEQEKRDNLVLEMAQQLCENAGISCQDCPKSHSPEEYGECELPEICNTLSDYVIRKEEEARKETLISILHDLKDMLDEHTYGSMDEECWERIYRKNIYKIFKNRGVEVEE